MQNLWLNGRILPETEALVPVLDRGLMLGDGLFETLRCRNFRPDFWDDHWGRLCDGARRTRMNLPWSGDELRAAVVSLCQANEATDATVRITLTRGAYKGVLAIDPLQPPTLVITASQVRHLPEELYVQGVALWVSSFRKGEPGSEGGLKATSYLHHVMAKAEADDHHCYEALLVDVRGRVLECSTASFFGVLDGVLRTAPLDGAILPGITRAKVMAVARELGLPMEERALSLDDLALCDEAMITSSVRGAVPVCRIGSRDLSVPGPVSQKILAAYKKMIDGQAP